MLVAMRVGEGGDKAGAMLLEQVEGLIRNSAYYTGIREGVTRDELEIFLKLLIQFEQFSEYESLVLSDASIAEGVRNYALATAGWAAHVLQDSPGTRMLIGQLEFFGMPEPAYEFKYGTVMAPAAPLTVQ